jgi:hypothetical protein
MIVYYVFWSLTDSSINQIRRQQCKCSTTICSAAAGQGLQEEAHQLAHALDQDDLPKIESDALSVLKHAKKEAKTKAQRSRDLQPMGPQYRVIRKTR